jgi:hypothetical protein
VGNILEISVLRLWWRNLDLRWSLLLVRLEEDRQSTIDLGYLMRYRERRVVLLPQSCMAMETLWVMF